MMIRATREKRCKNEERFSNNGRIEMAKFLCEIYNRYGSHENMIESQIVEDDHMAIEIEREVNAELAKHTNSESGPVLVIRCTNINLINHTTVLPFKRRAVELEQEWSQE